MAKGVATPGQAKAVSGNPYPDFRNIPVYDPEPEKTRQKVWDACTRHGYASRVCGMKMADCPPYVDDDMAISWRMGWRQADEERKVTKAHPDPDLVLRIRHGERNGWIGARFSEPAYRKEPVVIAGEYWMVTSVNVEGHDLVIELVRK